MKQPVVLFASLCFLASEAMQAQNAQNSPKAYVVSDAHLDTQWNWDIQTTIQEYDLQKLPRVLPYIMPKARR